MRVVAVVAAVLLAAFLGVLYALGSAVKHNRAWE